MNDDEVLANAEREFALHAVETMADAVRLARMMTEANASGRPVWSWSDRAVDPLDVFEAARTLREFSNGSGA